MPTWTPKQEWVGQDAHIIGGGASLLGFDFASLRGQNTIGCNDAFRLGPEVVKICLFGDASWWQKTKFELENFKGQIISCAPSLRNFNVPWLYFVERTRDGLRAQSEKQIGWNYSTGSAAINVAIWLGAKRIYLLGFDLDQHNGKTHWHAHRAKPTLEHSFKRFIRGFERLAQDLPSFPGVAVFQVTNNPSRLNCFTKLTVDQWRSR